MPLVQAGQRITAAVLSEDYSQADTAQRTVIATAAAQLSSAYTIPAGDPVGTSYRLTAYGNGTWGSTAQQLNLRAYMAGSQVNAIGVASSKFSTSEAFNFELRWLITLNTVGSSGLFSFSFTAILSSNTSGSTNDGGISPTRANSGQSINTLTPTAIQFDADWGAGPTGSTITCLGTLFEKLGG